MNSVHSLLFTLIIHLVSPSTVTWMRNAVFNLPENFVGGKLPCSKQTVVFPEELQEPIRFLGNVSVSEIILPNDGELFLEDVILALGADTEDQCEEGKVEFKDVSYSSWADPDVWSSEKFNDATPDRERIPCHEDTVLFPKNTQIDIELPKVTQFIDKMIIGDEEIFDAQSLAANFSFDFILNDEFETGLSFVNTKCSSKAGCPCQIIPLTINCHKKFCSEPKCLYPIQPTGHCCKICGGSITFETTPSYSMARFRDTVEEILKSYNSEDLVYHLAKLSSTELYGSVFATPSEFRDKFNDISGQVQLIIVEKGDYTGSSIEAINDVYHNMPRVETKKLFLSGTPINKAGLGGKIFVSVFFIAIAVMGAVYVYYYRLPNHWARNFSLNLSMPGRPILSRFQRRTDSVVSLARRDSDVSRVSAAGFRNPLYNSKRGRVVVTEPVEEED